jgi:hypothetical protein
MNLVRPMRASWIATYLACLAASAFLGYWSMTRGLLHSARPPTPLGYVSASILIVLLCTVGIWYAHRRGAVFQIPSLKRGFPGFREDPLQCLFVVTLISLGMCVGNVIGLRGSGSYCNSAFLMNLTILVSLHFAHALNYFLNRAVIRNV